jgi:adenylate kinase
MRARGEEVRIDDTPEVLSKRLASYRSMTEPLIHYYSERRKLLTVDGMMTIEHVTKEINRILAAIGAVEAKSAQKAAGKAAAKSPGKIVKTAKKAAKAARKAGKPVSKGAKKAGPKVRSAAKAGLGKSPKKSAKKVTKRRAKA